MKKGLFSTLILLSTFLTTCTLILPINEKEWMGWACDSDSDSADIVFIILLIATPLLVSGFLGYIFLLLKERSVGIIVMVGFCLILTAYHGSKWIELNAAYECLNAPLPPP